MTISPFNLRLALAAHANLMQCLLQGFGGAICCVVVPWRASLSACIEGSFQHLFKRAETPHSPNFDNYRMILFGYESNISFFFTIPATSYCTPIVSAILFSRPSSSVVWFNFFFRKTANGSFKLIVVPLSSWFPMMNIGDPL